MYAARRPFWNDGKEEAMKKRKSAGALALLFLLCAALTFLLCGTVSAAASPALTFALTVDGAELSGEEYIYSASPGDTLTVYFNVIRTDAAEPFALSTIQNEIEFDMDFFDFVDDSIATRYANADADLQTRVYGQRIIKASALGGPDYGIEQTFCEFQLKVKNNATGSGWIRCGEAKASDSDYAPVTITERNLTVSVNGASISTPVPTAIPTATPTPVSGSGGGGSGSGGSSGRGRAATATPTPNPTTTPTVTAAPALTPNVSAPPATVTPTYPAATLTPSPAISQTDCPKDASCPLAAFSDLDPSAWYHDGVHFCIENGVMNGYDDGSFKPQNIVTRAQLAMILWNRAGRPASDTELTFRDTNPDGWYAGAIRWVLREKLLTG